MHSSETEFLCKLTWSKIDIRDGFFVALGVSLAYITESIRVRQKFLCLYESVVF